MIMFNGKSYDSLKDVADMLQLSLSSLLNYRRIYKNDDKAIISNCNIFDINYLNEDGVMFEDARSICNYYNISYRIFKDKYNIGIPVDDIISYCLAIKDLFIYVNCNNFTEIQAKFDLSNSQLKRLKDTLFNEKCFKEDMIIIIAKEQYNENKFIPKYEKQIVFEGKLYNTIDELCKEKGISYNTYYHRIKRGYTIEEAFKPVAKHKKIIYNGIEYKSVASFARDTGLNLFTVHKRLKEGMSPEEIVSIGSKAKSFKVKFTFRSKPYSSYKQLARDYNLSYAVLRNRLNQGMSIEEAITYKPRKGKSNYVKFNDKVYYSYAELCSLNNISYHKFLAFIKEGYSVEECVIKCNNN